MAGYVVIIEVQAARFRWFGANTADFGMPCRDQLVILFLVPSSTPLLLVNFHAPVRLTCTTDPILILAFLAATNPAFTHWISPFWVGGG